MRYHDAVVAVVERERKNYQQIKGLLEAVPTSILEIPTNQGQCKNIACQGIKLQLSKKGINLYRFLGPTTKIILITSRPYKNWSCYFDLATSKVLNSIFFCKFLAKLLQESGPSILYFEDEKKKITEKVVYRSELQELIRVNLSSGTCSFYSNTNQAKIFREEMNACLANSDAKEFLETYDQSNPIIAQLIALDSIPQKLKKLQIPQPK